MRKRIMVASLLLFILLTWTTVFAANGVECYTVFDNQSVTAGSYVETEPIKLGVFTTSTSALWTVKSEGVFSFQPIVSSGTFTFTVYWSNFADPTGHWSSGTNIATGITSSDTDSITFDPEGPHLWLKIRATETGGTGTPSLSASLCTN